VFLAITFTVHERCPFQSFQTRVCYINSNYVSKTKATTATAAAAATKTTATTTLGRWLNE
jgi:hypothetical protein